MSRGHQSLIMFATAFGVASMFALNVKASTYHPAGNDIGFVCKAGKPKTLSYNEESQDLEVSKEHSPSIIQLAGNKLEIIIRYRFSETIDGFDVKHYYSSEIWLGDKKIETNNYIANTSSFLFGGEAHVLSGLI